MTLRKLRITLSAICGTACLLLSLLWARSYCRADLGLVLRHLFGIGAARSLQEEGGLADDMDLALLNLLTALERLLTPTPRSPPKNNRQPTARAGGLNSPITDFFNAASVPLKMYVRSSQ